MDICVSHKANRAGANNCPVRKRTKKCSPCWQLDCDDSEERAKKGRTLKFSGRNIVTIRFWAAIFIWPGQNSIWKLRGIMSWKSLSYVQLSQQNQCSGLTSASIEIDTPGVGCWETGHPASRAASWSALDLAGPYLHSWKSSFPRESPMGSLSDLCLVHVSPEGLREITLGLYTYSWVWKLICGFKIWDLKYEKYFTLFVRAVDSSPSMPEEPQE